MGDKDQGQWSEVECEAIDYRQRGHFEEDSTAQGNQSLAEGLPGYSGLYQGAFLLNFRLFANINVFVGE